MKKKKKEEEENEEEEEEKENVSVYSSYNEGGSDLEDFDLSKDMENNGEVIKKKWMDNSPKFKNRIIDYSRRRMAIMNKTHDMFNDFIKEDRMNDLNEKMKKIYEKVENERKEGEQKKKKRRRPFNFFDVDWKSLIEIEKKKRLYSLHHGQFTQPFL